MRSRQVDECGGQTAVAVEVIAGMAGWTVHVTENGEKLTKSFSEARFAESFANGQRLRLKIEPGHIK